MAGPAWALVAAALLIVAVLVVAVLTSRAPQAWHAPR